MLHPHVDINTINYEALDRSIEKTGFRWIKEKGA